MYLCRRLGLCSLLFSPSSSSSSLLNSSRVRSRSPFFPPSSFLANPLPPPSPRADYLLTPRKLTLLSLALLLLSFNYITTRGISYVSHPRLVLIDDVLNYSGKGYESGRRGRPLVAKMSVKSVEAQTMAKSKGLAMQRKESSVLPLMGSGTAKQD